MIIIDPVCGMKLKFIYLSERLNKLLTISKSGRIVIMCVEIFWFRCHRRWIAEQLVIAGHEVIHIKDDTKTYPHKLRKEVQED